MKGGGKVGEGPGVEEEIEIPDSLSWTRRKAREQIKCRVPSPFAETPEFMAPDLSSLASSSTNQSPTSTPYHSCLIGNWDGSQLPLSLSRLSPECRYCIHSPPPFLFNPDTDQRIN
jgi:hypothetical protein